MSSPEKKSFGQPKNSHDTHGHDNANHEKTSRGSPSPLAVALAAALASGAPNSLNAEADPNSLSKRIFPVVARETSTPEMAPLFGLDEYLPEEEEKARMERLKDQEKQETNRVWRALQHLSPPQEGGHGSFSNLINSEDWARWSPTERAVLLNTLITRKDIRDTMLPSILHHYGEYEESPVASSVIRTMAELVPQRLVYELTKPGRIRSALSDDLATLSLYQHALLWLPDEHLEVLIDSITDQLNNGPNSLSPDKMETIQKSIFLAQGLARQIRYAIEARNDEADTQHHIIYSEEVLRKQATLALKIQDILRTESGNRVLEKREQFLSRHDLVMLLAHNILVLNPNLSPEQVNASQIHETARNLVEERRALKETPTLQGQITLVADNETRTTQNEQGETVTYTPFASDQVVETLRQKNKSEPFGVTHPHNPSPSTNESIHPVRLEEGTTREMILEEIDKKFNESTPALPLHLIFQGHGYPEYLQLSAEKAQYLSVDEIARHLIERILSRIEQHIDGPPDTIFIDACFGTDFLENLVKEIVENLSESDRHSVGEHLILMTGAPEGSFSYYYPNKIPSDKNGINNPHLQQLLSAETFGDLFQMNNQNPTQALYMYKPIIDQNGNVALLQLK